MGSAAGASMTAGALAWHASMRAHDLQSTHPRDASAQASYCLVPTVFWTCIVRRGNAPCPGGWNVCAERAPPPAPSRGADRRAAPKNTNYTMWSEKTSYACARILVIAIIAQRWCPPPEHRQGCCRPQPSCSPSVRSAAAELPASCELYCCSAASTAVL